MRVWWYKIIRKLFLFFSFYYCCYSLW